MINTLEFVLSLGKKFPDMNFGFYDLEVAARSPWPINISLKDRSPSQILDDIEKAISIEN